MLGNSLSLPDFRQTRHSRSLLLEPLPRRPGSKMGYRLPVQHAAVSAQESCQGTVAFTQERLITPRTDTARPHSRGGPGTDPQPRSRARTPGGVNLLLPMSDMNSSVSSFTTLQNQQSNAVRSIVWSSFTVGPEPASPGQLIPLPNVSPTKKKKPRGIARGYDDLLAALANKDPEAAAAALQTAQAAAPSAGAGGGAGAGPRRARRQTRDSDDEDDNPHSLKARRRRLEQRMDNLRDNDVEFNNLALAVRNRTRRRAPRGARKKKKAQETSGEAEGDVTPEPTEANFIQANMRPLSPEKRSARLGLHAARDRDRMSRTRLARQTLIEEHSALMVQHRDRRIIKKNIEAAKRRAIALDKEQRRWLSVVAAGSRLQVWVGAVIKRRGVSEEEKEQEAAARVIQKYVRAFIYRKRQKAQLQERLEAQRKIRKCHQSWALRRIVQKKQVQADVIRFFVSEMSRSSRFQKMLKTYRHKVVYVQTWFRQLKTRRLAQSYVLDKSWLKTIQRKKQLKKDLQVQRDEAKDQSRLRKKTGKKEGEQPEWLRLENEIEAIPIFADKTVPQPIRTQLLTKWGKQHREAHKTEYRAFLVLWERYNKEMKDLQAIILARRAMGASDRDVMPAKPERPFYRMLPTESELLALIKEGELLAKRQKQGASRRR